DGIRYFHVTGVQTCALPIYRNRYSVWWVGPWARPVALELTSVPGVLRALESTTYSNAPADWLAARRVLSAQDLTDAVVTVVAHEIGRASCRERETVTEGGMR